MMSTDTTQQQMNIDTDHAEPNKPNKEINNETNNNIDKQNKLNIETNTGRKRNIRHYSNRQKFSI